METVASGRETVVLDLRLSRRQERGFRIFDLFDSLRAGDTLKVVFDHDLESLHRLLCVNRRGGFSWESRQEFAEEWAAWIRKLR